MLRQEKQKKLVHTLLVSVRKGECQEQAENEALT